MRLVVQRVKEARVEAEGRLIGRIGKGLLVFLGIAKTDSFKEAEFLARKIVELRVFEDHDGKMNLAAPHVNGAFLVVSQFTVLGNCDKGRRPSFDAAADPVKGEELYNYFVDQMKKYQVDVATGRFRAMMEVSLVNDGPVTFVIDSP